MQIYTDCYTIITCQMFTYCYIIIKFAQTYTDNRAQTRTDAHHGHAGHERRRQHVHPLVHLRAPAGGWGGGVGGGGGEEAQLGLRTTHDGSPTQHPAAGVPVAVLVLTPLPCSTKKGPAFKPPLWTRQLSGYLPAESPTQSLSKIPFELASIFCPSCLLYFDRI